MGFRKRQIWSSVCVVLVASGGCVTPQPAGGQPAQAQSLDVQAMQCLKAAIKYDANPLVRVEAVETLETSGRREALPWIRTALSDPHPAVRFAACVAVGRLRDPLAESAVQRLLSDENDSVRVAALFAWHRLGHTALTGRLATYLLEHDDPTVRRNAALVLGMMGEEGAVKMLARAMRDEDAGVRHHALEGMARMGTAEACQELTFMTNAGVGSDEVFAILALMRTGDPKYIDTFQYKLATAQHLETRLAAARALGRLGQDDGFDEAVRAVQTDRRVRDDPADPPEAQRLRARQMAAAALGEIGRGEALPVLGEVMTESDDPRLQVSAAQAILRIMDDAPETTLPFPAVRQSK